MREAHGGPIGPMSVSSPGCMAVGGSSCQEHKKILNACTYWDWDLDQDELEEEEMQFRYNRGRLAPGTDAWLRLVWLEGEHGELMFPWLP